MWETTVVLHWSPGLEASDGKIAKKLHPLVKPQAHHGPNRTLLQINLDLVATTRNSEALMRSASAHGSTTMGVGSFRTDQEADHKYMEENSDLEDRMDQLLETTTDEAQDDEDSMTKRPEVPDRQALAPFSPH